MTAARSVRCGSRMKHRPNTRPSSATPGAKGLREDEFVEYCFLRYPLKGVSQKKVVEDILKEVLVLFKERLKLMEGAREVIELFISQKIPIAVASSSEDFIIDAALIKLKIKDKMHIICSAEHETHGKPHPAVYLTTAKKLGVHPSECLVFEDSPNGLLAAKAAKMKCVVVPDAKGRHDKSFHIADLTLGSLKDFTLKHLEDLNK